MYYLHIKFQQNPFSLSIYSKPWIIIPLQQWKWNYTI